MTGQRVQPTETARPPTRQATSAGSSWWRIVLRILVDTAGKVFWEPVRSGSPRWATWPRGLRTIAALTGFAYVVCTILVIVSAQIRAIDPLVHSNGDTYPSWATTVLLWATVLVLALALTAALHTHPLFSVVVVLFVAVALVFTSIGSGAAAGWTLGVIVGLVVFFIVRGRREFAWFEFPVVLTLVTIGVYVPLVAAPFGAGADLRPLYLGLLMGVVSTLSVPMLVMAGYAPAEISVTVGEWLVNRLGVETTGSRWRRVVLGAGVAIGLVVLGFDVASGILRQDWDFRAAAWGASALVVAVSLTWSWLMLRRRPGDPPTGPTAWAWERYAWMIALLWVAVLIPIWVLLLASSLLSLTGLTSVFHAVQQFAVSERVYGVWRLVVCLVAVTWLLRARRLGERVVPVLLACFVSLTALGAVGQLSEGRVTVSWTLQPVVAVAAGVSLLLLVVALVRRRGIERQAWIALLALFLSALVGRGELLAEPGSLAAGVSGLAVVLAGLVWRVLTDAGITRGDSRWFPMPSRVLLFAANALLGTLVLAHLALTRQENPAIDVEDMAGVGIHVVGTPLVLGALMLGLLSTIGLEAPGRRSGRGTLPESLPHDTTSPPDEKTVIRENHT